MIYDNLSIVDVDLSKESIEKFSEFEIWDRSIWDAIEQFGDREFLVFWEFQGILSNGLGYYCFDHIPRNKKYILKIVKNQDKMKRRKSIIEKNQTKFEQLESKGFTFEEKIDSEYW